MTNARMRQSLFIYVFIYVYFNFHFPIFASGSESGHFVTEHTPPPKRTGTERQVKWVSKWASELVSECPDRRHPFLLILPHLERRVAGAFE